jgi:hypothetical protein
MKNFTIIVSFLCLLFACKNKQKTAQTNNQNTETKTDTLVFMERSPCFGNCPVYSVLILDNGQGTYHGKKFVEKQGVFTFKLQKEELLQIHNMANEIDIFSLKDKYDRPITDIPSTVIIYKENGLRKEILDRVDAPAELKRFEKLIDILIADKDWQPVE